MLKTKVCQMLRRPTLRLCHTFSQISNDAQKAIWACRIISEIRNAKEEVGYFEYIDGKKFIKPSLADTIKGLTLESIKCPNGY